MISKKILGADDVAKIMAAAQAEAERNGWAVTISVCDDGGHLLALKRLDGVAPIAAYISPEKARTAAQARPGMG